MESPQTTPHEEEMTLVDLFIAMAKRKRLILISTFAFTLFIGIISFVMDPVYKGTTRILIPQSGSSTSSVISQIAGASAGLISGMLGLGTSGEMYLGLLKSQTVAESIVDKFHLVELYKEDRILGSYRGYTRDAAIKRLVEETLKPELDTTGSILTIGVEAKDPKLAADMANEFVQELIRLSQTLALSTAAKSRVFFEVELRKSFDNLSAAEEALKGFQETSGAIQIEEQARAVLGGIATLEAQIAAKEIQAKVMKTYAAEQNPDLKRTQEELQGLIDQRKKLENQRESSAASPMLATASIPTLGTDFVRKMREFKYQETLYTLLAKSYETARLDEAKDPNILQIVDKASTPEQAIWPRRVIMILAALFVGGVLSVFFAVSLGHIERSAGRPDNKSKWEELRGYLRKF